jgi:hypothetical protein
MVLWTGATRLLRYARLRQETKLAMHRERRRLADEQEKDRALAIQTQRRASLAMARDIRSGLARDLDSRSMTVGAVAGFIDRRWDETETR